MSCHTGSTLPWKLTLSPGIASGGRPGYPRRSHEGRRMGTTASFHARHMQHVIQFHVRSRCPSHSHIRHPPYHHWNLMTRIMKLSVHKTQIGQGTTNTRNSEYVPRSTKVQVTHANVITCLGLMHHAVFVPSELQSACRKTVCIAVFVSSKH